MTDGTLDPTSFLNVDLDIWSRTDLAPLVAAFGNRVIVLHVGLEGRRHCAHLELAGGSTRGTADSLIQKFVVLIRALPRSARQHWRTASLKSFNIGVQASTHPFIYDLHLKPETLRGAACIGAAVTFCVYAAPTPAYTGAGIPPSRKGPSNLGVQRTVKELRFLPPAELDH